jgi:hypothetical protein
MSATKTDSARVLYSSRYVKLDEAGRTAEPMRVDYELLADFDEAELNFITNGKVMARVKLTDLFPGKHYVMVPPGIPQAYDPVTFSCRFEELEIVRFMPGLLWNDDVKADGLYESPYDYQPFPPSSNPDDVDRGDDAGGYSGYDVAVIRFSPNYRRNAQLKAAGKPPELEMLGVNLVDGMEITCSKDDPAAVKFSTALRDVTTVSTKSHVLRRDAPVLQAARFTVPQGVVEERNTIQIVGKPR